MKKRRKVFAFLNGILIPLLLLLLWELAARYGLIKEALMPRPSKIGSTLLELSLKGKLQRDILMSLKRVLLGYLVGSFFGIIMGILLGLFPMFNAALKLLMEVLRPVPIIAWVPVLILWIGIDEKSKVVVIAIGTFWPVLLNSISGIVDVDKKYLEISRILMK